MQFSVQQLELASQLGLDSTQSDTATLLKRWLNISQRMILGAADWPFLRAPYPLVIQTVADFTTGTVATILGGTTGTFSSAPTTSKTGFFIQTSSSSDWYRIASHTASSTSFTIDSPGWTTTAAAATLTVRKFYYSVGSSDVDRILNIREAITPFSLNEISKEQFDAILPNPTQTGIPRLYLMAGKDTTDYWQFVLWPSPSTAMNLYIEYLKAGTDLSADADVSIIPAKWHSTAMIEGAKVLGYRYMDDTRESSSKASFDQMLDSMKRNLLPSTKLSRGFRSVEDNAFANDFPLPSNYPNV